MLEVGSTWRGAERVIRSGQGAKEGPLAEQKDLVGSIVSVRYVTYLAPPASSITPSAEVFCVLC